MNLNDKTTENQIDTYEHIHTYTLLCDYRFTCHTFESKCHFEANDSIIISSDRIASMNGWNRENFSTDQFFISHSIFQYGEIVENISRLKILSNASWHFANFEYKQFCIEYWKVEVV